jgi:hypothetical protein
MGDIENLVIAEVRGKSTPEKEHMAKRVEGFMNYFLSNTEEGKEFLEQSRRAEEKYRIAMIDVLFKGVGIYKVSNRTEV